MSDHYQLGKKGEQVACDFLIAKGYKILSRNYRFKKAEIDIIAQLNELLVVVEVKTRTSTFFGNPQDFISQKKIKRLVQAINRYVYDNATDLEIRFDIVAVVFENNKFSIEHLEDAFLHF